MERSAMSDAASAAPRDAERVAITGALGFVASRLIPRLLSRGRRPIAIVRPGRDAAGLEAQGVEVRRANLTNQETLGGAFVGVDALIHLSGMSQTPGLLPALRDARVSRGVFVSSAGVHTRLLSPGADSKRRGEAALRESGLGYVILRPSMVYGTPADRNMVRLLRWIEKKPFLPLPGAGHVLQQPIHVDDLVEAILAALDRPAGTRAEYDVGGPEPLPLRELVLICASELGRRVWLIPLNLGLAHGAVVMARRMRIPCPVSPEQVLRLTESKAVDIGPMRRDLGVEPRSFRDGIRAEAEALRSGR
jgi:uncharacterized protein YbjT (DUF2867 family)